jgi:penicillin-binding protein 1B
VQSVARRTWKWALGAVLASGFAVAAIAFIVWVVRLDREIVAEFGGRRWTEPSRVYAAPRALAPGIRLDARALAAELDALRYRRVERIPRPGEYFVRGGEILLYTRRAQFIDGAREAQLARVQFADGAVTQVANLNGKPMQRVRLDPPVIGSLFPIHGEDRLIVRPDEIPRTLAAAIKAIEDKDFDRHSGVDYGAVIRALWVNARSGEIEQGASTLTQQLVKNYFLDGRRTWRRKIKEAIMAQRLEAHYDKREILTAYVNEIYLGQDGSRAIHGFGLASQFYFGRQLDELESDQIALLVGMIRGPSLYDPRRNPTRATERRNYVLAELHRQKLIDKATLTEARARPLALANASDRSGRTYYPAFLDLVRRQLVARGFSGENAATGHTVFTTLDPELQRTAERALTTELEKLSQVSAKKRKKGQKPVPLEGVVVVTNPSSGDVLALVGGRNTALAGFNRALDARRPIGSLVKPFVYLSALETGRYHSASIIEDMPLVVRTTRNQDWEPRNFDKTFHGPVPMVRALAESMNAAAVSVALDVGVEQVAGTLSDMGLGRRPRAVPALALGAVDASPFEVAQLYGTLANNGLKQPLRAIQGISEQGSGTTAGASFAFAPKRVAPYEAVYQVDQMLVAVMDHGTGRSGRIALPTDLTVAGKSGTSSGYRDSWFAGFSGQHLIVVWVGTDGNETTGLTGSSGALQVWSAVMQSLATTPWRATMPPGYEMRRIDGQGGEMLSDFCASPGIEIVLPRGTTLPESYECGVAPGRRFEDETWSDGWLESGGMEPPPGETDEDRSVGERIRDWWRRIIQ